MVNITLVVSTSLSNTKSTTLSLIYHVSQFYVFVEYSIQSSVGLKLKLQDQTEPFKLFSYALFPLTDKCVPVDWKVLVSDDVESEHIRCHGLRDGDDLSMLVANFKGQHAKALILLNTQENYSIAPQFLEGTMTV